MTFENLYLLLLLFTIDTFLYRANIEKYTLEKIVRLSTRSVAR